MQAVSGLSEQFVGKTIGDYAIEQFIGQGQLRAIYWARHTVQKTPVLFTVFLPPDTVSTQGRARFVTRFVREGKTLLRLRHPHILPLLNVGEQAGYPYLVMPYTRGSSLAQMLKQQGRFTPEQALEIFKPIAAALDYAHAEGIVHGALSATNVLHDGEQTIRVTNFGFTRLIQLEDIEQNAPPYAHLLSISGAPLGTLPYIAPEVVQGLPFDARADVFAAGVILFELLSGTLPFGAVDSLDAVLRLPRQSAPLLSTVCPGVPDGLDLVVQQALISDPAQRFQSVGRIALAFERVLSVLAAAQAPVEAKAARRVQTTLPPTTDWTSGHTTMGKAWQLQPPIVTGHLPAIPSSATRSAAGGEQAGKAEGVQSLHDSTADPFALLAKNTATQPEGQLPGTFASETLADTPTAQPAQAQPGPRPNRRRVVAMLAAGGVLTVGVLGVSGLGLARILQQTSHSSQTASVQSPNSTVSAAKNIPAATKTNGQPQNMPTATQQATPTPQPTAPPAQAVPTTAPAPAPTKAPPPPTPAPQPTPTTPPQNNGTVIGATSMAANSAKDFTNADNAASILIHLPNGSFAAFEKACTHMGVLVNYDSGTQQLVCPAHGSIFDPANGGRVTHGPAMTPLQRIAISVNANGTITIG